MDTKILIEEINRINELTVSKAIFTENTDVNIDREEPWVLTEQSKKILSKVDDIFISSINILVSIVLCFKYLELVLV